MAACTARIHHILLALSGAFYLASHSAAFSAWDHPGVISRLADHDTFLALNVTVGMFDLLDLDWCSMEELPPPGAVTRPAVIRRGSTFPRPVMLISTPEGSLREKHDYDNCTARFFSHFSSAFEEEIVIGLSESMSRRVPRPTPHRLPDQPRERKYGRRAMTTRKKQQPVAIRGELASSWLKQAAVAGSALFGLICAVPALLLCCIRGKRLRQSTSVIELRRGLGPREFRYRELAAATDNFAEQKKIGRGGFGPVYCGYLSDQDRHVAIKTLSEEPTAVQGRKEFEAEVSVMSQLRHRNIVQLVGWYRRRGRLALVYELMPGGSLDTHLYSPDRRLLTWPERYKIALGLGSALRYLHTECDQCIVHGDIKPANVMLDASRNAKLGDFGLARLDDHGAEPRTTQVVAGTLGYIDPEFVSSGRPSAESDVYSFGVVLLEIACGRRPTLTRTDHQASTALLASVRGMYHRNQIVDAADRRLNGEFDRLQMERLLVTGLWCAHHDPMRRPSVAQAMDVLRSADAKLPVLAEMRGAGEVRSLEAQAYDDVPAENSAYLTTESASLMTDDSEHSQCIIC
ncbi:unnamed protein product [Triticum aestivum]|uniref:Protein kinase domain-containing protein n=2 Tax=Triticum aestivum TaxID=4565 RepID=A0A9R1EXS6_WHEAT|nr:probable kinase CHARK [Triticum aestivum]KAF7018458.1 hypothetical protein CFC21_031749 [Triticum aestivum]KAF7018459.1 hypothetical protein CFC21_031750 [Triticum aestivum]SPT19999.1 unnamed protein product [Triticum aestivum]